MSKHLPVLVNPAGSSTYYEHESVRARGEGAWHILREQGTHTLCGREARAGWSWDWSGTVSLTGDHVCQTCQRVYQRTNDT